MAGVGPALLLIANNSLFAALDPALAWPCSSQYHEVPITKSGMF